MQMTAQQVNSTEGLTYMTCSFFLFMVSMFMFMALKRFVVRNKPLLPTHDDVPDDKYVLVVG
jgi:hypothetical protein